ncbi:MAG: ABC transporter permease [Bryobacteraceae bacterium]
MPFILTTVVKEFRRLRRDPLLFTVWMGVPVLIALLFSLVFGRGQAMPQGTLLLADEDDSLASTLVAGAFNQGQLGKMIRVEQVTTAAGRERMARGGASAFLRIPKGFAADFVNSRPVRLELVTNPAQRIMPGIIQETVSILTEGGHYIQWIFGEQLRQMQGGAPSDTNVAKLSVEINRAIQTVSTHLNPPAIVLDTKVVEETTRPVNFGAAMLPGMLMMTVLFLGGGFAGEMWKEKLGGTLRRLAMTPSHLNLYLAGKVVTFGMVMTLVTVPALAAGARLLDAPVRQGPLAVAWIVSGGAVLFLLVLLLQMLASSERAANVLTSMVTFPLLMIGGCFFPFESMPAGMARIGKATPNGWMLVRFRSLLEGSADAAGTGLAFLLVAVVGGLAFVLAARRLRRGFIY